MIFNLLKKTLFLLIFCSFFSKTAIASVSLIRDAEIESFLWQLSDPLIRAADLKSENIKIYIVDDNLVNAFVSGGQNMFINTGLITKFSTPDALIGVVAHEIGHIKAGHLLRVNEGMDDARKAMMLSYLLGLGAFAGGSFDGGSALIMGGNHIASRLQQKYTRTQEEVADQYALSFLQEISYPAHGLVKLLKYFHNEFKPYAAIVDEYSLSHPISQKRIDLILARTQSQKFSNKAINIVLQPQMDIVRGKIEGFKANSDQVIAKYKGNKSYLAQYISAIAWHKKGNSNKSLNLIDNVITKARQGKAWRFNLGFLYELKGQFLYEMGDIKNSLIYYDKAIKALPNKSSNLAKIAFANAILSLTSKDQELLQLALKYLNQAQNFEKDNPFLLLTSAKIYDALKRKGDSYLSLARHYLLIDEKDKAKEYAKKAQEEFGDNKSLAVDDLLESLSEE